MKPTHGRYSKVSRRMWVDEKFLRLSAPKPNARTLWERLLTGPELGCIPGLFPARLAALADALGWSAAATSRCWSEIDREGMAEADWQRGLIWVPKAIEHNEPESPNVVRGWRTAWQELPDSPLKDRAHAALMLYLGSMGEPWAKAFAEATGKASPKASGKPSDKPSPKAMANQNPSPNQEQEQEQKQEQKPDSDARAGAREAGDESGILCPPSLRLTDDQIGNAEMGMGAKRWQVEAMCLAIVGRWCDGATRRPSEAHWRRQLWVAFGADWKDTAKRPQHQAVTLDPEKARTAAEKRNQADARRRQRDLAERYPEVTGADLDAARRALGVA